MRVLETDTENERSAHNETLTQLRVLEMKLQQQ